MPFPFNVLLVIVIGFILIAIAQAFTPPRQRPAVEPVGDLLVRLDALPLQHFADLITALIARMGLRVDHIAPLDGEADGIAVIALHPRELLGGVYAIYCVRGADQLIGVHLVHRLRHFAKEEGAMKAIFITTGGFTPEALNATTALPGIPIEFVDGNRLEDWLSEHLPQEIAELPPAPPRGDLLQFPHTN
ncbi:hypothetical protein HRbin17_00099 [bacterium HR17]|jgi:restriction endonuclease Mrr|uniref:Restriction endonuclease type IV Mrr domain-containing protein n=1 Tax=Candidatus Fervidibacter japonicus TaxID=2035412 RepID=A0A2H5X8V6_9BACT|nr:hypothetical protein HRbin17_00099 [bacterium HR17]